MTWVLMRKLLRDVVLGLVLVCLLLFAFQCLWAKVAERIGQLLAEFTSQVSFRFIVEHIFSGPGRIMQALMGGESIDIQNALDRLSISYVHPLTQTLLCVWAVGRSSGAVAGELDRGTMELLLAQPVPRRNLILAHLGVDGPHLGGMLSSLGFAMKRLPGKQDPLVRDWVAGQYRLPPDIAAVIRELA